MGSMIAAALHRPAMAPDDNAQSFMDSIRGALPMVVASTCLVMMGTSLNMWSTQRLIEQSIQTILKSDAAQTNEIKQAKEHINTLRVEHGITRARVDAMDRRSY